MEEDIARVTSHFSWKPELVHGETLGFYDAYTLVGMGGSHLAAGLLTHHLPSLPLTIWHDYGVPKESAGPRLYILSSYSGDTEEVRTLFDALHASGTPMAVVTSGGALLTKAKDASIPHIILPPMTAPPRALMVYQLLAFARITSGDALLEEISTVGKTISLSEAKAHGSELGEVLVGKIPVLYASSHNHPLAYIYKIFFNESAKIPAFVSAIPEACHNELASYEKNTKTGALRDILLPVILYDEHDHPHTRTRMEEFEKVLSGAGVSYTRISIRADGIEAGLSSYLQAAYASITLAGVYGVEDSATPLIDSFKKNLSL